MNPKFLTDEDIAHLIFFTTLYGNHAFQPQNIIAPNVHWFRLALRMKLVSHGFNETVVGVTKQAMKEAYETWLKDMLKELDYTQDQM